MSEESADDLPNDEFWRRNFTLSEYTDSRGKDSLNMIRSSIKSKRSSKSYLLDSVKLRCLHF